MKRYIILSLIALISAASISYAQQGNEPQVVNYDFNSWCQEGHVWYPDLNLTPQYYFWYSGNKGADSFGTHNLTMPEADFVVSGKASMLPS